MTKSGFLYCLAIALAGKLKRIEQEKLAGYFVGFADAASDDRVRGSVIGTLFEQFFEKPEQVIRSVPNWASSGSELFLHGAGMGYADGERFFATCDGEFRINAGALKHVFVSAEML